MKRALPSPDDIPSTGKRNRFSIDELLEEKERQISTTSSLKDEGKEESDDDISPLLLTSLNQSSHHSIDAECRLEGKELWAKFFDLGTEMIITKSGRRMFPTVKVSVQTNDIHALFYVFLDVVPVDQKRYRYIYNKSSWLAAGKAEPSPSARLYMHPDSPFTYDQLQKQVISFEKAKLTNNDVEKTNHLILNSMHKYQPRVHVVRREKNEPIDDPLTVHLADESFRTFVFPETQFMAVTAYQNQLITKLKIEKNPFAKGFRDPGGRDSDYESDLRLESRPLVPPSLYNPALLQQALLTQYWLGKQNPSLLSRLFLSSPLSLQSFPSIDTSPPIPQSTPSPAKTPTP
ncbi:mab-9 [Pristionchus pacificus]|uniref:Mab-9 n=1 Tax=Pristionchus pacificus TaxID=54126 RepID=A0A2A6CJ80_PRIPA|nr:mab-9 [Pristionchus pacificus]|eukprot:PDM78103.1 mab-9 [Pristionchus pacificus]